MHEDVRKLMKHAHDLERRGREADAEITYSAASEIARMRAEFTWHPIETAPRDGRKIFGFLDYGDPAKEMRVIAWTGDSRWPWRLDGDSHSDRVREGVPTHWMPLPLPPSPTSPSNVQERREDV